MLSGMAFGDGPLGGDYSMQAGPHDGIKSLMRGAERELAPTFSLCEDTRRPLTTNPGQILDLPAPWSCMSQPPDYET